MRSITTQEIFDRFATVHNGKYDYTESDFVSMRSKIKIICQKHGPFFQTPEAHSTRGCPKCGRENKEPRITQELIIAQFEKQHGNRYDYSKTQYQSATENVEIICRKHGSFFQTPSAHKNGSNCHECVRENRYSNKEKNLDQFKAVHGTTYDYSKVKFYSNISPVEIICYTHGSFFQTPAEHKRGEGCPFCAKEK